MFGMGLKYSHGRIVQRGRMLDLESYFRRIGYSGSRSPTLATLRALQAHHPRTIPFENLDTFTGRPVRLDLDSLQQKLVHGGRGGYCFEQNTLFKHVLSELGVPVTALAARVVWERPAGEVRARTHMVLLADLEEGRYLCDVGFGGLTPTGPLKLTPVVEQPTPHETFRILDLGREHAVEAHLRGEWKRLYRFDLQEQEAVDIEMLNHYVISHSDSPMIGRLIAARTEPDRRFGLLNGGLTTYGTNGVVERRRVSSVAELRDVLRGTFSIDVPSGADIDAALARVLAAP
jgi:N-hydroxyarylamine O-acetyltransferase